MPRQLPALLPANSIIIGHQDCEYGFILITRPNAQRQRFVSDQLQDSEKNWLQFLCKSFPHTEVDYQPTAHLDYCWVSTILNTYNRSTSNDNRKGNDYLPHIFGKSDYVVIHDPNRLSQELPRLYALLTQ